MTQYTDEVEEHKLKLEAEEWGKKINYVHAQNGVIETKFNNGDIRYEENKPGGKTTWHREKTSKESLIDKFFRWQADYQYKASQVQKSVENKDLQDLK